MLLFKVLNVFRPEQRKRLIDIYIFSQQRTAIKMVEWLNGYDVTGYD